MLSNSIVWLLMALFLGNFVYGHFIRLRAVVPAVAQDLYVIGMVVASIRLITGIGQIDYAQPITAIQRHVTKLRMLRIRITIGAVLAGTLAWAAIPFLLVVISGAKEINSSVQAWLWGNEHPLIHRLMNSISGHSLNKAEAFLAKLSEFEEQGPFPGTAGQQS